MINIKRFVDINIIHKEQTAVNSIRDTVALITNEHDAEITDTTDLFSSLADFITTKHIDVEDIENSPYHDTYLYMETFFNNGGNKIKLIENITDSTSALGTAIDALPNELIVVAYTGTQRFIKEVAIARSQSSSVYGVNSKLLLLSTDDIGEDIDKSIIEGIIYKYTDNFEDVMTIAAYLSNINIYGINTIQDYCFTVENVKTVVDDDNLFKNLSENNINVDVKLAGTNRNYGGNTKNGLDLVNEFVLIVMQQTVTDRVLTALTQKLKNEEGLATLSAAMTEELNRYVTNGYLNTSAIWTDPDYDVQYNGKTYTVVEQNTSLPSGYRIKILPYSSLTAEDKLLHSTPPIYLAVADSYGIRKVTINGSVFE